MKSQLLETLERINWHYGRGDVQKIKLNQNGTGQATILYGWGITVNEVINFRLTGNKVTFRGVTRTLGYKVR